MNMITKSTGMNTMNKNIKKTSQGRKKIEIKKIEEGNSRQVTFSKRRTGIFKKAAELCVLTGSEIAIIVNSPGGRVYAFGHPNPDVIIDRYLNTNNAEGTPTSQIPPLVIKEFNQFYVQKSMELEAEKRRKEMIQVSKTVNGDGLPWYHVNFDIDGMEVDKLEPYLLALVELKKKVLVRADEVEMIKKNPKFVGFEHVGCKHVGFEHARSGHVGFNMLDIGDLGFTNEIPNTMIPTNNMDTADMF